MTKLLSLKKLWFTPSMNYNRQII